MVMRDPPEHTRLRAPVARALSALMTERLRTRVRQAAEALAARARETGGMDVMKEFAHALPNVTIAELFDLPGGGFQRLAEWSPRVVRAVDKLSTSEERAAGARALVECCEYMRGLVGNRRAAPADDLVSHLAFPAAGEESLTDHEIAATCVLLLVAAYETTSNLIGNGLLALVSHPDQLALLRREPGRIPDAVEELIRFDGTAQMVSRTAHDEIAAGAVRIAPGDGIVCVLGAANRDPLRFPNPDRLDVTRAPGGHLGMGGGIHYCVGASLGRLTAIEAFAALLDRCPRLEPSASPVRRQDVVMRSLLSFPVAV